MHFFTSGGFEGHLPGLLPVDESICQAHAVSFSGQLGYWFFRQSIALSLKRFREVPRESNMSGHVINTENEKEGTSDSTSCQKMFEDGRYTVVRSCSIFLFITGTKLNVCAFSQSESRFLESIEF